MTRHVVTGDHRTFHELAQVFHAQGITIDHFHAVVVTGGQERRYHLNRQPDGSFQPKRGTAPSDCIADYASVIADPRHPR